MLRFRDVRVIGPEGEQIGILQSRQALNMAKEQGLDLVMVSPTANPPVCKIIDHGKFKYLSEKQAKVSKRKQQEVKGIKISPRIAEHDIQFQLKKAKTFLEEGHKVRILCMFRAREVTHADLGKKKLEKMAEQMKDLATVERIPQLDGRQMIMVLIPKPNIGKTKEKDAKEKEKNVKAENKQDSGEEVQGDGNGQDNSPEIPQQPPVPAQERSSEETP